MEICQIPLKRFASEWDQDNEQARQRAFCGNLASTHKTTWNGFQPDRRRSGQWF